MADMSREDLLAVHLNLPQHSDLSLQQSSHPVRDGLELVLSDSSAGISRYPTEFQSPTPLQLRPKSFCLTVPCCGDFGISFACFLSEVRQWPESLPCVLSLDPVVGLDMWAEGSGPEPWQTAIRPG